MFYTMFNRAREKMKHLRKRGSMTDELTAEEKARLLAVVDGKNINDYDRKFYQAMCRINPLPLNEIDDKVRSAILCFIMDGQVIASQDNNGGLLMIGFVHGYMVGRKLKRDIRRRGKEQNE